MINYLLIFFLAVSLGILCRNIWVFNKRTTVSHNDYKHKLHNYDKLPSYDMMMLKFWIWDVKRFYMGNK